MRIGDLLARNAVLYRDKPAVCIVDGPTLTYAELLDRTRRFASGLTDLGIVRGDRIAVLAHNGLVFFDVYLAAAQIGAIAVPINTRLAAPEARYILDHADPKLLVVDQPHAETVEAHLSAPRVVVEGSPDYDELLNTPAQDLEDIADENDTALMIYTSGTTGRPKGVCLSQRALTTNALTLAACQRLVPDDVFLSITPLYHVATGTRVTTMLVDGQTHVVMPHFDADRCLHAIATYRVTTLVAVPVQLRRILDSEALPTTDLTSLRLLVYGAAPSGTDLIHELREKLPCDLYQGYGLSEAVTNLTGLLPEDHARATQEGPQLLESCGRVVPGVRIEIRDEEGCLVPARDIGEIWVRTDKLMSGYWRDPVATQEAIVNGWLRTGDLAWQDEDGYLFLVGRSKDMLISGGVNIYPSEIEAILREHPEVEEAAVIGRADQEWGEVPIAFVMLHEDAVFDPDGLRSFCESRLARFKVPKSFQALENFPRTSTGKIRKAELPR